MGRAQVTVILVGYKGDRWLPDCLRTLVRASAARLHLVLVDNYDTAVDRLDLTPFDAEVLKTPEPLGFAEANNYALVHARSLSEGILFLNQDTLSQDHWIDACLACLEASPRLGAVSPFIRTYDGSGWDPSFLAFVEESGQGDQLSGARETEEAWFEVMHAPAAALLVRKDVLRRIGPFDPIFGSYYEDTDLCRRIRHLGYQIGFCRRATIAHYSGSVTDSRERELRRMRQIIRNRLLHRLREAEAARLPFLCEHMMVHFPRNLVRGVLRTASSQPPSVTLKAHWDLLRIAGRLASQRRDEAAWKEYLQGVGWPHRVPGLMSE